jgi:hypothetical protein
MVNRAGSSGSGRWKSVLKVPRPLFSEEKLEGRVEGVLGERGKKAAGYDDTED